MYVPARKPIKPPKLEKPVLIKSQFFSAIIVYILPKNKAKNIFNKATQSNMSFRIPAFANLTLGITNPITKDVTNKMEYK